MRWCVIYRIHVVHGGTRYIYHRIKVSIEVFVDNPVITALETSRHWPGPLMKDPLDISVLCSLPRAWRTWERAGCSPGWSSLPSGMETLRPLPLLGEQPGLYLNNSQSSVSCSHGGYSPGCCSSSHLVLESQLPPGPPGRAGWAARRPQRPPGVTGGDRVGSLTLRRGRGRRGRRAET